MPRFNPKEVVPKFEKPTVADVAVVFVPNNPPDRNDDDDVGADVLIAG